MVLSKSLLLTNIINKINQEMRKYGQVKTTFQEDDNNVLFSFHLKEEGKKLTSKSKDVIIGYFNEISKDFDIKLFNVDSTIVVAYIEEEAEKPARGEKAHDLVIL